MTTESQPRLKITYATLRADNEDLQAAYEAGLERAKARLGQGHRNFIDGKERDGDGTFEVRSPIDTDILLGTFAKGTRRDVQDAVAAARRAQPAWFRLGWERRLEILRRAAELISERQMEYAGLMAIEVGKTRLEALGEVEEAADLIRYYATTAEDNAFYDHPMDNLGDAAVHTRTILRPHGVFDGAGRRPVGGSDDGRQHGRLQAGQRRGDDRDRDPRGLPRRRRAGRGVQPRDGPRRLRR
jgi:1-pyrroline-5-carboxylate dehydrogenase